MPRDYYEILGVERTASNGDIATAYRKLAIMYHPDKNQGDEEAIGRFKEAAEAFEVLNDQQKRSRYDQFGHAGVNGNRGGGGHFHDVEDIFSAFGDIFGDLFGGGRNRVQKGRDVRCDVTLTLHEAAGGVTKSVQFQRHERCEDCAGSGAARDSKRETCGYCGGAGGVIQSAGIVRMQTTCPACHGAGATISKPCSTCRGAGQKLKRVETNVQIPPGVDDGMRVRITGQGEPSPNGGPAGDCYCFVSLLPHKLFERDGQNLICRVPITYSQAALGASSKSPRLMAAANWCSPPARKRAPCSNWAAKGCPIRGDAGWAICWCRSPSKSPRNCLPKKTSYCANWRSSNRSTSLPSGRVSFKLLKSILWRPMKRPLRPKIRS